MKLLVYVLSALLLLSCVSADENNCQNVDVSNLNTDDLLRDALTQGIQWLFRQASDKYGTSSDSNIQVTKVNSICTWQEGHDIYSIFDCEATNNNDATLQVTFTVRSKDDDSAPPKVIKWNYHIEYSTNSEEENNNYSDDANDENDHEDDIQVEVEINFEEGTCEEEGGEEEALIPPSTEETCQDIDISELETSDLLREAFNDGIRWLFQQAAERYGTSADENIEVTNVASICNWQVGNDIYNRFECDATNNKDATIQVTFTVNCKDDDSAPPKVVKWNYHIEYKTDSEENNQETDNGQDVEVEITVENDENEESDGNDENDGNDGNDENEENDGNDGNDVQVEIDLDLENDNGGSEEENNGGEISATSEENCQDVDLSQLRDSGSLREALSDGIEWLFQQAADRYGTSSDSNIEVTNVKSVCSWQVGNDIYNRFECEATNNNDATLQATFTVNSKDDDSEAPRVVKWNYHIEYKTDSDNQQDDASSE